MQIVSLIAMNQKKSLGEDVNTVFTVKTYGPAIKQLLLEWSLVEQPVKLKDQQEQRGVQTFIIHIDFADLPSNNDLSKKLNVESGANTNLLSTLHSEKK